MSPLFTSKILSLGNYQKLSYKRLKSLSKREITFVESLFVTLVCAYDALQGVICHAGETELQDYVLVRNSFSETFLRAIYYCCSEGPLLQVSLVGLSLFRYRFRGILSRISLIYKLPVFCFSVLLITQVILYIWKRYRQTKNS